MKRVLIFNRNYNTQKKNRNKERQFPRATSVSTS